MAAIRGTLPIGLLVLASWFLPATARPAPPAPSPGLRVADVESGCPLIEGGFVALLRADRGMLLLSAAPFEGGRRLGTATGAGLRAAMAGGTDWTIGRVGTTGSRTPVFGAAYPFRAAAVTGCVAFDKEPFGSEGDLVTYLQWLVEDVYTKLPASERQRFPAFLLDSRRVRLRVEHPGNGALELSGGEGSSLAFKLSGDERTFVLVPFVLDAPSATLAIRVLAAEGAIWQSAPKDELGWTVGSAAAPARFEAPALTITVEAVRANE